MTFVLVLLFQLFALMPLAADIPSSAPAPVTEFTVIPRDVFIGDEMEVRYSFESAYALLPSGAETLKLKVDDTEDVSVLDMVLSKEGSLYVVTVRCMGWRTGSVSIPEADVSEFNPELEESVVIRIPPVTILSVVDYTEKHELRPALAPLVIPGTTWIIYAIIILCVILFVTVIIIVVKFKAFKTRFLEAFSSVLISRDNRLLRRRMKRLLKRYGDAETEVFATELAHFIRGYMSVRFGKDFEPVTASEFTSVFSDVMDEMVSPEVSEATENIASILLRCDYVRFSGDAGETGQLSSEERHTMCQSFITATICYDREATA